MILPEIDPETNKMFLREVIHHQQEQIHNQLVEKAEVEFIAEIVQSEPEKVMEALGIEETECDSPIEEAIEGFKCVVRDLAATERPVPSVRSFYPEPVVEHPAVKLELAELGHQEDMIGNEWYVLKPTNKGSELIEEWDIIHDSLSRPA